MDLINHVFDADAANGAVGVTALMHKGRIAERGRHEALLERGGLYARLYELQFEEKSSDSPS